MKVLFICNGNVGRSQAAEAYFNKLSKKHSASSAGINASKYENKSIRELSSTAVDCLKEDGVDISEKRSKQLTQEMVNEADLIVSMEEKIPLNLDSKKVIYWSVENPKGYPLESYIKVRDQIKKKVNALLEELE